MKKISQEDIEKELITITQQLLTETGVPYKRELKMDVSLQRTLGIDSLGRAELFRRVEKTFNVNVPDRLLAEAETLKDIAKFLHEAEPKIKKTSQQQIITAHGQKTNIVPANAESLIDVLLLYAEKFPDKSHIYFQKE